MTIRAGLTLLGVALIFGLGLHLGGLSGRAKCAESQAKVLEAQRQAIEAEAKRADEAEDKLAKALAKIPQTGKKVADAVRKNPTPSNCVLPDAVADSLQAGIDSGRAATR